MSLPDLSGIIPKNGVYTYTFNDPIQSNVYAVSIPPIHGNALCQFDESIGNYVLTYTPILFNYTGTDNFLMERYADLGGGDRGPSEYFQVTIITSDPPNIVKGLPPIRNVYQLDRPVLTVTVASEAPLTYNWYIDNVLKQGPSNSAEFRIESTQYELGNYDLRVDITNAIGSVSSSCVLTIQLSPATIPLAVADPSGGITSGVGGGVLTVAGPDGASGRWTTGGAPTVNLVDPSDATLTVADMTAAYNTLMWSLRQVRALQTEPRMFFGSAGNQGLIITRPTTTIDTPSIIIVPRPSVYIPYGTDGPRISITMSDVITGLNELFSYLPDNIRFTYADDRITLTMSDGDVKFTNPDPLSFGSGERILARIFNDPSGGGIVMGQTYNGQLIVQGKPFTNNGIEGDFPVPASATITTPISATESSLSVTWTPSTSPDVVRYYVTLYSAGGSFIKTDVVPATTSATSYTNTIPSPTILTSYGGRSPDFTITAAGQITGWKIYSAAWSPQIKTYLYKNGVNVAEVWVPDTPPSASVVKWRTVAAPSPITVVPGDAVFISHTSLETFRTYQFATNPASVGVTPTDKAIVEFIVANPITRTITDLSPATTYKVQVVSSTPYEISEGDALISGVTASPVPPVTGLVGFKNPIGSTYTFYWKPVLPPPYNIEVTVYPSVGSPQITVVPANLNSGSNSYGTLLIAYEGTLVQVEARFMLGASVGPKTSAAVSPTPIPPP